MQIRKSGYLEAPSSVDHLEKLKKGPDEILRGNSPGIIYNSFIKSINNYQVLIQNYEFKGEEVGYFSFTAVNNKHTSALAGSIEYPKSEKELVREELDKMLKSLVFKK